MLRVEFVLLYQSEWEPACYIKNVHYELQQQFVVPDEVHAYGVNLQLTSILPLNQEMSFSTLQRCY
jgi:hypothetical protein